MAKAKTQPQAANLDNARMKYFIQLLDVKSDNNMTRIYTALKASDFFNTKQKKKYE